MEETKTTDVFQKLERRISDAVDKVATLRSQCGELQNENTNLESQVKELKQNNIELSNQINDLKMKHEKYASSFNREEVRKKIDHMLEKFGELQL